MIRLFIGIKIENQQKLIDLSSSLKMQLSESNASWVNPYNFHLTLKFLGEVENYYINSIITLLTEISHKVQSFDLHYNKLGYFGTATQPKVIWFDFKPNKNLNLLQELIENSMTDLGFKREEKIYSPHLTFARIKKMTDNSNFNEIIKSQTAYSDSFNVSNFQLIESSLKPTGPVYSNVEEFRLMKL
jgi:RNA 2',3'-cyclic 3'-phosphodiesterase